ncbi:MAG: site-specific DNA-methyltransferase [Gemmatimonadetes bacterium]|nr:site-specific DNA-methyltransferase [Gemmatimonadota bacterium]
MAANFANRTIWTGDCLYVLRGMDSETVDLIYLDPPFNSNANYAAPIGSQAAGAAFKDTWTLSDVDAEWVNLIEAKHPALHRVLLAAITDSDKSYLVYMAARILEMRRVLKPTGSIYLHCDPTMSHYLKLVMDAIFGRRNFRDEIVWNRSAENLSRKKLRRATESLLYYTGGGMSGRGIRPTNL